MILDRKSRLMLILGLLNDCFGDLRSTVVNLSDFISSHPDFEEIEEFRLKEILREAEELDRKIVEVMDRIKRELFTQ